MPFTRADVAAAAQRSLAAAAAHDREAWIGLFTADGRVEDPVGSAPHRGRAAIGRFYDTFIAPRTITAHVQGEDIVVDTTVLRDVELEIEMSPAVSLRVPTFIRYDLRADGDDLQVCALSAYWELPAMIGQFARAGLGVVPVGVSLGRSMFANQGIGGSVGFLRGFRGSGGAGKRVFARFLDDACGGDEVGMRRLLSDAPVTLVDGDPLTSSDVVGYLSGGTWSKLIASGDAVAARVDTDGHHRILLADTAGGLTRERPTITRVRLFA